MRSVLVLAITVASWVALLWFGIAPDFGKRSYLDLIGLHALPPVAVWLCWLISPAWIKRNEARQRDERERRAQAERQAALEAARALHEQELLHRRFACDCRAVAISDLTMRENLEIPEAPNVWIDMASPGEKAEELVDTALLDALHPAIAQVLRNVYSACGAAAAFPLYIVPPANTHGAEVDQRLRAIHAKLIGELDLPLDLPGSAPSVRYFPVGDSAANSIIGLFESDPDLPGAVVLAFDSLLPHPDLALSDFDIESEKRVGKPGHGVFALLVTHPDLRAMLDAVADQGDPGQSDSLAAFWEKSAPPQGNLALLTLAPKDLRRELGQLPLLARIHRAAFAQVRKHQDGALSSKGSLTALLERAQINAGLKDVPFVHDNAGEPPAGDIKEKEDATACAWLVHNAGGMERSGRRLAAIGNALTQFEIDLDPIAQGTNVAQSVGDLGQAMSVSMLALALAQAGAKAAPTLCTEYSEPDGIALAFAVPERDRHGEEK